MTTSSAGDQGDERKRSASSLDGVTTACHGASERPGSKTPLAELEGDEQPCVPEGPFRAPSRDLVKAVLLAQLLSLALAVTGVSSELLAQRGVAAPTTQALLNYLLLAATFGVARAWQRRPLAQPLWVYGLLALLDVEANYLVTKAYQYTSITSVTLLDCFSLPAVMLLSWLLLRARFRCAHYGGAALCVAGLTLLVATDGRSATGGPAQLLGDGLVLAGAACYALSNVAQEKLLGSEVAPTELLALLGACGSLVAGAQVLLLERRELAQLRLAPGAWPPMLAFAGALYVFYALVPQVLIWGGAAALNLSLLSSDGWAALARLALFGGFGGSAGFFGASLGLVGGGIVAYAAGGETKAAPAPGTAAALGAAGGGGGGASGRGAAAAAGQPAYQRLGAHEWEGRASERAGDEEQGPMTRAWRG